MVIKFKKLAKDAKLPKYAYKEDAGMDVFSNEDKIIKPKTWEVIKTGFCMELPKGYEAETRSKSGIALKNGVFVLNSPGTIDENYRGEVMVILMNLGEKDYIVKRFDKIAQMVINKVEHFDFLEVDDLSNTNRQEKGFGSTGIRD